MCSRERTGVLVIRAWSEALPERSLRARITQTLDISTGTSVQTAAGTEEQILATVRTWLQEFTGGSDVRR
jgi:hypothetical protein